MPRKNTFIQKRLKGLAVDDAIGEKVLSLITGSEIMLTIDEIKDIMKVISSLENGGILLKGTTKKISSQEEGLLNFWLVYH